MQTQQIYMTYFTVAPCSVLIWSSLSHEYVTHKNIIKSDQNLHAPDDYNTIGCTENFDHSV